jgi:DNA-binding LacI/PurR family transcriptional regulator
MRPRTRRRILGTIERLNYQPSRAARQLRTGRAPFVGLVVPSVANPFWGSFARTVEAEALQHGFQVLLCNSERDPIREQAYVAELWASGVRAVVIGTSLPSLAHLQPMLDQGLRLIAFDRERQPDDPPAVLSVSVDNRLGSRLVTDHLLSLGHRRIGFVSGAIRTISRQRRLIGYKEALKDAGLPVIDELIWSASGDSGFGDVDSAQLGRRGMASLLELSEWPTAVVTINDMYAIGACAAVRGLGLRVPDDVAVAGFDDIVLAPLFNPPLTTVRQPLEEMSRLVIEAVAEANVDVSGQAMSIVIPPKLVIRASTGGGFSKGSGVGIKNGFEEEG